MPLIFLFYVQVASFREINNSWKNTVPKIAYFLVVSSNVFHLFEYIVTVFVLQSEQRSSFQCIDPHNSAIFFDHFYDPFVAPNSSYFVP